MKISIGSFSMEFNWDTTPGNVSIKEPETIKRSEVNAMSICATTRGGLYVGDVNGNAIILSYNDGQTTGSWYHAFKFAKKCKLFGYTDWVVPNPDELLRIYQQFAPDHTIFSLFKVGQQQAFRTIRYWTDREANCNFALTRDFGKLFDFDVQKVDREGIRVIRRIPIIED